MAYKIQARLVVYGQPKMTKNERRLLRDWLVEKSKDIVREENFSNRVTFTYESPFRTIGPSGT